MLPLMSMDMYKKLRQRIKTVEKTTNMSQEEN
jgi:hypothetical protein